MATHEEVKSNHAALLDGQRRILDYIASGAPLEKSLDAIARLAEQHAEGVRCSVLLVDESGQRLSFVAGPSIPADYKKEVDSCLRIGPDIGPCARAAYVREPVYTKDTTTDPRWEKFRDVAARYGMRAVWSTPILGDDNSVLGTFAMSYRAPGLPSREHVRMIDVAVQMARVAIEAKRDADALRRSEESLRRVIDAIPAMVWSAQPSGSVDFISDHWLRYTGIHRDQAMGSRWTAVVHPDDIARVTETRRSVFRLGEPAEIELRLRGADGRYRWFLARLVPVRDPAGKIMRWYGVSTDIHDRKEVAETLRRNQELFLAEARRIGALLGTSGPAGGVEAASPDGSPRDGESALAAGRKLEAECKAIATLTARERSIFALITTGKSNLEVAESLHLSPRTVETYRARLMEKLQVEDVVGLVKLAIRHGITGVD